VADVEEPVDRDDVVLGGLPMVRVQGRALEKSGRRRWQLLDEILDPGEHGAFVVMLSPHTALAHVIRDRNAAAAVGVLVAEAKRRGQERPQVHHLHDTLAAVVALVERNGASNLDPRDAELVRRIKALAPTPEEEGGADAVMEHEPDPPHRTIPLGPAVLELAHVEAVLWAVRRHGGEPAVIGWGPHGAARIVDLPSQPPAALRRLLVRSADGQVEVVLDRRASHVSGPDPTPERIRQIVAARRRLRLAYLHPRLWWRALFPSGPILACTFAGFALAAADGEYVRGVVPYVIAIMAASAVHVLYRLVVLPRRESTWHSDLAGRLGGPVCIVQPGRRAG
jgi:hypothetical protein